MSSKKQVWFGWCAFVALTLITTLPTLMTSPAPWQDEIQIIDFGRRFLEPSTKVAVTFDSRNMQPVTTLAWVGAVASESAYRLVGEYGPRLLMLAGAVAVSALFLLWLLREANSRAEQWLALGLSVVLLSDTFAIQSYRGGRIDSWAMAIVLLAVILVGGAQRKRWLWVVSGMLYALSFYVWSRSVLLFPLMALPLGKLIEQKGIKEASVCVLSFLLSGAVLGGLLLIPGSSALGLLAAAADGPFVSKLSEKLLWAYNGVAPEMRAKIPVFWLAIVLATFAGWKFSKWFYVMLVGSVVLYIGLATHWHRFNWYYFLVPMLLIIWRSGCTLLQSTQAYRRNLIVWSLPIVIALNAGSMLQNLWRDVRRDIAEAKRSGPDYKDVIRQDDIVYSFSFDSYYSLRAAHVIPVCCVYGFTPGVWDYWKSWQDWSDFQNRLKSNVMIISKKHQGYPWIGEAIKSFGATTPPTILRDGSQVYRRQAP